MILLRHLITIMCICVFSSANAADDVTAFYASLQSVFIKHYPTAKFSTKDQTATVDHDTRLFMIHELFKTGEWQDAREQGGPKKGGVYCMIVSQSGIYSRAAEVPQTFDKFYFTVLLLAPYSKRLDCHLHVLLSYPSDASNEFLRDFTEVINKFSAY